MAKFKPSKDKKKHIVKKMQETEGLNSGFGEYGESTGGGHPFEKGNSNTRTTQENGKKRKAENPTTNQPRTNDGKFTYKSVNGKSIDPKYGPSRGKTVPPTLTGGVNGIKIEDVEEQFSSQSGAYWDDYKDKWYKVGGKVVTQGLSTKISGKAVWNQAKEYNSALGEYDEIIGDEFSGKGEAANWTTKTGKKSNAEKEAMGKAKAEKAQQNVIHKESGAIETVGGNKDTKKAITDFIKSKQEPAQPEQEPIQEPVVEDKPWGKTGKFKESDKNKALSRIKQELGSEYNEEFWTDENLEEVMEQNPDLLN